MYKFRTIIKILLLYLISFSCTSIPNHTLVEPTWIHQPARSVDSGYIIYVASALNRIPEQAKFEATGAVIEDIANECSFPPKGAHLEDEFLTTSGILNQAYVKMAVPFQDCEEAQKAVEPSSITKLANASLTTLLKRYQDKIDYETEEGEEQQHTLVTQNEQNSSHSEPTLPQSNQVTYLVQRQQLAYAKEVIILAGPGAYPIGSPQSSQFVSSIHPVVTQIQNYKNSNPELKQSTISWSSLPIRPGVKGISGVQGMRVSRPYVPRVYQGASRRFSNSFFQKKGFQPRTRFRRRIQRIRH